jgi:hypothetical protein
MTTPRDPRAAALPSATPTEAELAAWDALSRDEQIRLTRAALTHPDCSAATNENMTAILATARQRAAARTDG